MLRSEPRQQSRATCDAPSMKPFCVVGGFPSTHRPCPTRLGVANRSRALDASRPPDGATSCNDHKRCRPRPLCRGRARRSAEACSPPLGGALRKPRRTIGGRGYCICQPGTRHRAVSLDLLPRPASPCDPPVLTPGQQGQSSFAVSAHPTTGAAPSCPCTQPAGQYRTRVPPSVPQSSRTPFAIGPARQSLPPSPPPGNRQRDSTFLRRRRGYLAGARRGALMRPSRKLRSLYVSRCTRTAVAEACAPPACRRGSVGARRRHAPRAHVHGHREWYAYASREAVTRQGLSTWPASRARDTGTPHNARGQMPPRSGPIACTSRGGPFLKESRRSPLPPRSLLRHRNGESAELRISDGRARSAPDGRGASS